MNQGFKVYHYNKDGRHLYPESTETSPETVSRDAYHEIGSVLGYDADAVFDKLNYGALSQSLGVRSLSTGDIPGSASRLAGAKPAGVRPRR